MGSFTDPDSLRNAFAYMMKMVDELENTQAPKSDVEKAKSFITENISDPITVKDVADHVCLSAEYFTKLFKKETGQTPNQYRRFADDG
jgi:AraC-like DNA-binding protein